MQLTGLGLYTFREASRFTGIRSDELHRWLRGYGSRNDGKSMHGALWKSELVASGVDALSFHDLLEVRFVKAFRQHGVSLQTIRTVAEFARDTLDSPYPFTCRRFETDGETIFSSALRETEDGQTLDMHRRQCVFRQIIKPSLYAGIEFGADQRALRWFPSEGNRQIVMDPAIAFGKPIVAKVAVRTQALYDAWLAEGKDKKKVARLYEVSSAAMDAAVRFESRLAA